MSVEIKISAPLPRKVVYIERDFTTEDGSIRFHNYYPSELASLASEHRASQSFFVSDFASFWNVD